MLMQIDRLDNGIEIVSAPEISGVSDHDVATQAPFLAKGTVLRRDRRDDASIRPVGDDANATRIDSLLVERSCHAMAGDDIHLCRFERAVAQATEKVEYWATRSTGYAKLLGNFRKQVLNQLMRRAPFRRAMGAARIDSRGGSVLAMMTSPRLVARHRPNPALK